MSGANIRRIAGKELTLFFSSPIGYLFLLIFLAATLFAFFWWEAFFARNIADVRPMFELFPIMLLLLCAALTMRMWSDERRSGTLEFVATVPVTTWSFVLGKFLACWTLLAVALLLTLPLPITVAFVGNLDWGPVVAGYLAAMLLGGAYLAIGLTVSASTSNQIVSLIVTVLACAVLYLVGHGKITDLVAEGLAQWMRGIGTGSRFESITRGVLDFRDLYYYASLTVAFLALNVFLLERSKWAQDGDRVRHRNFRVGTALAIANLLVANLWLANFTSARVDMTAGGLYSISDATRTYLEQLREPLLIRGYFSGKTHPLLAPLVPQMKDLLTEFEVAGRGRVRVEFVDPARDPAAEDEANSKYGIRPVPFQVADRYQSSLVNSYFDVLVQYGDEFEVLGFRDLIEVKVEGEADLDVLLRNPEYDVTRTIKKVLQGFQSGGKVFDSLAGPVKFVGYVSDDAVLPPQLVEFKQKVRDVLEGIRADAGDKLTAEFVDPQAGDGSLAKEIGEEYGFRPMAASLFDANTFYFYLTLSDGKSVVPVPLPDDLSEEGLKRNLDAGFKRFASGYLKSVALVAPESNQFMMAQGMGGAQYEQLVDALSANLNIERTTLDDGRVPQSAEVLVVVAPEQLSQKQVFAVDQFLMQGGTVVLSTSPFAASLSQSSLSMTRRVSGLEEWLGHNGITLDESLVMDPQNAAFPIPVSRQVSGFTFQEIHMLDYPYFVDVRGNGLSRGTEITADLPQVTVAWPSPIAVDAEKNATRTVTELLRSSPDSWRSSSTDIMPRIDSSGRSGFTPEGEQSAALVGVLIEGSFSSLFSERPNPLLAKAEETDDGDDVDETSGADEAASDEEASDEEKATGAGVISGVIDRSPESARLFVFSSNDFLSDQTLGVIGSAEGTVYGNSLQLLANAVDWSLEDRELLGIRSRGHFNRTLPPLAEGEQALLEYVNYGIALLGVLAVFFVYRTRERARMNRFRGWLAKGAV
jgi:ABC-2 type transport system permease protein